MCIRDRAISNGLSGKAPLPKTTNSLWISQCFSMGTLENHVVILAQFTQNGKNVTDMALAAVRHGD